MGHIRLDTLLHTRRWQEVVSLIEQGTAAAQVANAAIRAAEAGLLRTSHDQSLSKSSDSVSASTSACKPVLRAT